MSRRKLLATMGALPLAGGLASVATRGGSMWGSDGPPLRHGSARELIQQKHLPNVPLVTHDGERVRFYDDLVKDRKVVVNFMDTRLPDSETTTRNLAAVQAFFNPRVGRDIYMYSISFNPADTAAVLRRWADRHFAGPGWLFLTGGEADVDRLRRAMGFGSPNPAEDADPAFTAGAIRYGNEPEMRWAHCQALAAPRVIAHSLLLDFGVDPTDPNAPPAWNCELLASIGS